MNKNEISNVACGILFDKNFSILDEWGSIADLVLKNNQYFSPEYFPRISIHSNEDKRLFDEEKGHYLQLTSCNLVFSHMINNNNFDNEYKLFKERVLKFLVPRIVFNYKLAVSRIGLVFEYPIKQDIAKKITSKYFNNNYKDVSDFRFSKREQTIEGANFNDNNNFINIIYSLFSNNINKNIFSYDYQLHLIPHKIDVENDVSFLFDNAIEKMVKELDF